MPRLRGVPRYQLITTYLRKPDSGVHDDGAHPDIGVYSAIEVYTPISRYSQTSGFGVYSDIEAYTPMSGVYPDIWLYPDTSGYVSVSVSGPPSLTMRLNLCVGLLRQR